MITTKLEISVSLDLFLEEQRLTLAILITPSVVSL